MAMTLLGLPNILSKPYSIFSTDGFAGLEPVDMGPSLLKTEEPSEVARLNSLDPKHTVWSFDLSEVESDFSAFSVVNHNLVYGDYIRFTGRNFGAFTDIVRLQTAPNAITAPSNITGSVTNVDEAIDTPDGLVIEPTTKTSSWSVRFTWPTFAVPMLGTARSQFVLRMIRRFTGAGETNPTTYPKLTVNLYEEGVLIRQLGWRAVTSTATEGQIFIFPFDIDELTDSTGANIECEIVCTPGLSLSGGQYTVVESLSLYTESVIEGGTTSNDEVFNSGWIQIPQTGSVNPPTKSIHFMTPILWSNIVDGKIWIMSDGAIKDPTLRITDSAIAVGVIDTEPLTYVEAGVICGGDIFELSIGIQSEGPQINVEIEEISGNTLGGQSYGADSFRRRICDPTSIVVSREERDFLLDYIAWQRGHSEAFYIILEPEVTLERQLFTSFWGTLKLLSTPVQLMMEQNDVAMYRMTIAFEEKL